MTNGDAFEARLRVALAEHYDILDTLGEGGMALVYRARDRKHDREVAVKVLRPEIATSLGGDRFLREIRVTAKLSHPHILQLYDSGEADGLLYYVMPLIPGESLRDLMDREKQLSIDEAIRICREVGEALAYAHSYGLVHRDIKPENVLMQSGHAIVADFGIARAVSEAGGQQLTQTGMAIGTPAYMSPEQGAGDPDVDGRADIYSLGCMLYELLVGQIPFPAPSVQAMIARHTMDQVAPPSIMRDTITPDLENIMFCALAKLPADRFRTAQEMVDALKAVEQGAAVTGRASLMGTARQSVARQPTFQTFANLSTSQQPVTPAWRRAMVPTVSTAVVIAAGVVGWLVFGNGGGMAPDSPLDVRRVAVLPFEDLSPDGSLAPVADGLTEGLIDQLGTVRTLSVVSRNGVARFRDQAVRPDSVARLVEAGTVITGSLQPRGDDITVSTRLIDGFSGSIERRTSVSVPATDLLGAQQSIAAEVSDVLRQWLGEEIEIRERRATASNQDAWILVQRAERLREDAETRRSNGDADAALSAVDEADSLLATAQRLDPDWAEPTILRAWAAYRRAQWSPRAQRPAIIRAGMTEVDGVLADGTDAGTEARALEIRGHLRHLLWRTGDNPTAPDQHALLESARDDLVTATDLDPSLATAHLELSYLYYDLDDEQAALLAARRALEEDAYLRNADEIMLRLFWGHLDNEQLLQAGRWCREGARRFPAQPGFLQCQLWLLATPATAQVTAADVDRAWEWYHRLDTMAGDEPSPLSVHAELVMGGVLARSGLVDSARAVWSRARGKVTAELDPHQSLLSVEAYMRTHAGDLDESIDLLKRYVAANPDHGFEQTAGTIWYWRELRDHPRFTEITGTGR